MTQIVLNQVNEIQGISIGMMWVSSYRSKKIKARIKTGSATSKQIYRWKILEMIGNISINNNS